MYSNAEFANSNSCDANKPSLVDIVTLVRLFYVSRVSRPIYCGRERNVCNIGLSFVPTVSHPFVMTAATIFRAYPRRHQHAARWRNAFISDADMANNLCNKIRVQFNDRSPFSANQSITQSIVAGQLRLFLEPQNTCDLFVRQPANVDSKNRVKNVTQGRTFEVENPNSLRKT